MTDSSRMLRHRFLRGLLLLMGVLVGGGGGPPVAAQPLPVPDRGAARPGIASEEKWKSPALALGLSVAGTAVPLLASGIGRDGPDHAFLTGMGVAFGPSLGNLYAKNLTRAQRGLMIRGAGVSITGVGLVFGVAAVFGDGGARAVARGTIGVGLATVAVGAIYDIATAPLSAIEYNEARNLSARVRPAVGVWGEQVGLALRVSF